MEFDTEELILVYACRHQFIVFQQIIYQSKFPIFVFEGLIIRPGGVGLFDTTQFLKWFCWKMIKGAVVEVSWLTKQISRRDLFSKYICCILWTYWILQNIFYISVCLSVCPFFKILPFRSQWCVSPSPHERFSVYNLYISEPPAVTQWHIHVRRRRTFWHYLALKYAQ